MKLHLMALGFILMSQMVFAEEATPDRFSKLQVLNRLGDQNMTLGQELGLVHEKLSEISLEKWFNNEDTCRKIDEATIILDMIYTRNLWVYSDPHPGSDLYSFKTIVESDSRIFNDEIIRSDVKSGLLSAETDIRAYMIDLIFERYAPSSSARAFLGMLSDSQCGTGFTRQYGSSIKAASPQVYLGEAIKRLRLGDRIYTTTGFYLMGQANR